MLEANYLHNHLKRCFFFLIKHHVLQLFWDKHIWSLASRCSGQLDMLRLLYVICTTMYLWGVVVLDLDSHPGHNKRPIPQIKDHSHTT